MLFLLFQLGKDRYALAANRFVEVLPLVALKRLPQAPIGLAGLCNYRGRPVPALDFCALALGHPASARLRPRIISVKYPDAGGTGQLLGLIAECTSRMVRKEAKV